MKGPADIQRIRPEQLRIGMYVMLPEGWLDHPFLRNSFVIGSEKDLEKVRALGDELIPVDLTRSRLPKGWRLQAVTMDELERVSHQDRIEPEPQEPVPEEQTAPPQWNPSTLVPEALHDAIADRRMAPERRSRVVYQHSREMMKRLLETPTTENLSTSKKVISDIAELILADDQTASNMLRITSHDFYTYTHSVNVGVSAIMLAKEMYRHSDAHDIHELGAGFFLHDLGKTRVRAEVINKPGRLSDAEMKHMRIHPYQGYKLLEQAEMMSEECRYIIMQHHERVDGTGYPQRLAGEQIHQYGRLCCIADVFDALTAERSYKTAMTPFEALKLMKEQMLNHFDKEMFATFVRLYSR